MFLIWSVTLKRTQSYKVDDHQFYAVCFGVSAGRSVGWAVKRVTDGEDMREIIGNQ